MDLVAVGVYSKKGQLSSYMASQISSFCLGYESFYLAVVQRHQLSGQSGHGFPVVCGVTNWIEASRNSILATRDQWDQSFPGASLGNKCLVLQDYNLGPQ